MRHLVKATSALTSKNPQALSSGISSGSDSVEMAQFDRAGGSILSESPNKKDAGKTNVIEH